MRFLFALLIACLTMPAMAAPCAPIMPAAHLMWEGEHGTHHTPPHDAVKKGHDCIGCIAPIDGLKRTGKPAPAMPLLRETARNDRAPARLRDCPATPPPKPLA